MDKITQEIQKLLGAAGIKDAVDFSVPPKPDMGDIACPMFAFAKESGKNPAEFANMVAEKIYEGPLQKAKYVEGVQAFGPYVNFFVDKAALAELVFSEMQKQGAQYGTNKNGKSKKIVTEFAHPNTHKAFHIGHLRNILTGESISRLLENSGYSVTRVNYQGDVGLHIAKALYGLEGLQKEYEAAKKLPDGRAAIAERAAFLGKAYTAGSQAFETDENAKKRVIEYNEKIYTKEDSIKEVYETTRAWSLEYFDSIYAQVGTKFERLYFESEVFARGKELVQNFLKKGVFRESQGAVIFPGGEHGLHDRVFINSKGYPTYEGKEMGLAELQLSENKPDQIIHITGREQADYFAVVFKAIEKIFPKAVGKEKHLWYGWVSLKSGKMSSRTGKVVLGEWLLDEVRKKIADIMKDVNVADKEVTLEKIAVGAVKYSMLKTGVQNDTSFDIEESISTSGNSGPYLQYICARINSMLRKAGEATAVYKNSVSKIEIGAEFAPKDCRGLDIHQSEVDLLWKLYRYPQVAESAAKEYDPSKVAQFLFDLAQSFNTFYNDCPVLGSDGHVLAFRLALIRAVRAVMEHGLNLIGIETVEEM